jgi:general secretion pathway protein N
VRRVAWLMFALSYGLVLLVQAPASMLSGVLERASHGQVTLANAHGSLWQGDAVPLIHTAQNAPIALSVLHWHVAPLRLLTGQLHASLQWDDAPSNTPMELTLTRHQAALAHLSADLPAALLGHFAPLLRPAQLQGHFQIHGEPILLTEQGIQGSATADWLQAGSSFSTLSPLGSYRITLMGAGERLNARLVTLSGVLLLNGQGGWARAQGMSFQGTAAAASGSESELTELLNHLGPQDAAGAHRIDL